MHLQRTILTSRVDACPLDVQAGLWTSLCTPLNTSNLFKAFSIKPFLKIFKALSLIPKNTKNEFQISDGSILFRAINDFNYFFKIVLRSHLEPKCKI